MSAPLNLATLRARVDSLRGTAQEALCDDVLAVLAVLREIRAAAQPFTATDIIKHGALSRGRGREYLAHLDRLRDALAQVRDGP